MIQHTQHGLGGQESESVFLVCTCATIIFLLFLSLSFPTATVDSSALLEAALCAVKPNPGQCVRQQAARVLGNWEDILNAKKMEMLGKCSWENWTAHFTFKSTAA